jgi:phosphoribosylamine--glycine ligase
VKVFVIGSGGREHALVWKLAQSESVSQIYATPGNPGIAQLATCLPLPDHSPYALLHAAQELQIDLTVVGPEAPLVAGVVDAFRAAGLRIVGPTRVNAQLEGSKVYAKNFFASHNIPTAAFQTVSTTSETEAVLSKSRYPLVIKADGLAAGKGVVIAQNFDQARHAAATLGPKLVIEEFLHGEEVSFIVLTDGKTILELEPCQDHKAAYDDDRGPNTGGMGAYCDSHILTPPQRAQILDRIVRPTIEATGFTGFLYAGLMMTADGPRLLEYNVRLGDPETQPILHRMVADFGQVLLSAAEQRLAEAHVVWRPEPSVAVVLAAEGYPEKPNVGDPIDGIDSAERMGATVFQAGTRFQSPALYTNGGRVLTVTHRGPDLQTAIANAYAAVAKIHFRGMHFRRDIGRKGVSRWPASPVQ